MRNILSRAAAFCLAVTGLMTACAGVSAQQQAQVRMAEAAHKGIGNNIREAPDNHSRVIVKLPQGTRFEVVGQQGDWYAVVLADGTHGWSFKTNVRFE